jgi:Rab-GTPase-TBC domain
MASANVKAICRQKGLESKRRYHVWRSIAVQATKTSTAAQTVQISPNETPIIAVVASSVALANQRNRDRCSDASDIKIRIDKDVDRTFPEHPYFEKKEGQARLSALLQQLASKYPYIGYYQSLNCIAAMCIIVCNDVAAAAAADDDDAGAADDQDDHDHDNAMVLLEHVTARILPYDYHEHNCIGATADAITVAALVKKRANKWYTFLCDEGVDIISIVSPWLNTAFVGIVPHKHALRIWDTMFVEGKKALIRIATALLLLAQTPIEAANITGAGELTSALQQFASDSNDSQLETLMDKAFHGLGTIKRRKLNKMRQQAKNAIVTSFL